jgi:hypothetical protein
MKHRVVIEFESGNMNKKPDNPDMHAVADVVDGVGRALLRRGLSTKFTVAHLYVPTQTEWKLWADPPKTHLQIDPDWGDSDAHK